MKTKIIMMTALVALLATGCGKEQKNGRIRIFAENMTAAANSKLMIDPASPANSAQWLKDETILINDQLLTIDDDPERGEGYAVDAGSITDPFYYAIYPGDAFNNNDVDVRNDDVTAPVITLNSLALNFHSDGTHDVVFPMGAKAEDGDETMVFRHLTAGFRMTLHATTDLDDVYHLKVIVYGSAAAGPVEVDEIPGVSYTVQWAEQGEGILLPGGGVGTVTDRDVAYASVMNFDLYTDDAAGVTLSGDKQLCIPLTLATVKRITVIGYDDTDTELFSKSSAVNSQTLLRNKIYPVGPINVN